jgi:hypothetical protein
LALGRQPRSGTTNRIEIDRSELGRAETEQEVRRHVGVGVAHVVGEVSVVLVDLEVTEFALCSWPTRDQVAHLLVPHETDLHVFGREHADVKAPSERILRVKSVVQLAIAGKNALTVDAGGERPSDRDAYFHPRVLRQRRCG